MLRGSDEMPVMPQCADAALRAFYSELTEADIEFVQRGGQIVVNCADTRCEHYPCAYSGVGEKT